MSTRTGKGSLVEFLDRYLEDLVEAVRGGLGELGSGGGSTTTAGATTDGPTTDGPTTAATTTAEPTPTATYAGPPGEVVRVLVAARQAIQAARKAVDSRAPERADRRIRRARERLDRAIAAVDEESLPPRVRDLLARRLPVTDRYTGLALDEGL
mgnify:FL=1